MRYKYILSFFTLVILTNSYELNSQIVEKDTLKPYFEWVLPLIDIPFAKDAAWAEANNRLNYRSSESEIILEDYSRFFRNLSMMQNTEMARNLHGSFYYGINTFWYRFLKPTSSKRYFYNRLLANVTATATDFLLIKLPYGFAYQHEEFHRGVLITRGIYSYDEVWSFGKGFDIAVTHVKDEDLAFLKRNYPADMVRLMSAGVEAEYAYFQRLREDNFFKSANHPFVGITVLGTIHAVSYVNLPFASKFNSITDSILSYDKTDILARDFTGYDFSAWIYDLVRSDEPYENRGQWPDGIGIKRPVKESDLTPEMKNFLRETGNMQYLNFITPFILGINKFRVNDSYFNFALRSTPTSFGYYAGGDFYFDTQSNKFLIGLGVNRSKNLTLPVVEFIKYNFNLFSIQRLTTDLKALVWLQPKDQRFHAESSSLGFFAGLKPEFRISNHFSFFSQIEYKTKGWVFSNPYLDEKFTFRLGVTIKTS